MNGSLNEALSSLITLVKGFNKKTAHEKAEIFKESCYALSVLSQQDDIIGPGLQKMLSVHQTLKSGAIGNLLSEENNFFEDYIRSFIDNPVALKLFIEELSLKLEELETATSRK